MLRLVRGIALLTAAGLVVLVEQVLIDGLGLIIFVDQRVNLFRGHAQVLRHDMTVARWGQTILEQQRIDRVVAGEIPAVLHTVLAARKMRQGAVQGLVRQHELGLRHRQGVDVIGVVIELARVGGGGRAPVRIGRSQRQAQHQCAEERLVQDQLGARGGQLGFDGIKFHV